MLLMQGAGVDCSYTKCVWLEIESKLQLENLWLGDYVEHYPKTWRSNKELKGIIYFPLIVLWFIWKARYLSCFEDYLPFPIHVSIQSLGVLRYIPHNLIFIKTRLMVEEIIGKCSPWSFFDGSAL